MREERIAKLLAFLEQNPNDNFLRYALAQEYIGMQKDDLAKDILETLLKESPDYIASYYHYGKLLQRKGKNDEAENIFEKGISIGTELKEHHAVKELKDALNELLFDDY